MALPVGPCPLPGLTLDPATPSDLTEMLALEREHMRATIERFYPGSWDDEHARELLRELLPQSRLVRRGSELLGFFAWSKDGEDAAWLFSIQVRPEARGRGLGAWLMACFERDAKAAGLAWAVLAVHEGNPAQRLYERLGYRVAGDDGPHAWVLRKRLAD